MQRLTSLFYGLIFLLLVLFAGCSDKQLQPADYITWVEQTGNGLHKQKVIGAIRYDLQYRPLEYIILKEAGKTPPDEEHVAKRKQKLHGLEYYHLRFSTADGTGDVMQEGDPSMYHDRNTYLMFDFRYDIHLLAGSDTLSCKLYHFENHQGVAPYADVLFGFEASKSAGSGREIIIDDKAFGSGQVRFEINGQAIKNTPQLTTR